MVTYNTARDIPLRRQEGDSSDLTLVVPSLLPMTGASVRLQVWGIAGRVLLAIVHMVSIRPLQPQKGAQNAVVVELARIEKYRYEIHNDFEKTKSEVKITWV